MAHRKTVRHFHEAGHLHELTLEYIHNNPVTRGLCRRAPDWKWSSARYYLDQPARQQHPGLPRIDGLPEDAIS